MQTTGCMQRLTNIMLGVRENCQAQVSGSGVMVRCHGQVSGVI